MQQLISRSYEHKIISTVFNQVIGVARAWVLSHMRLVHLVEVVTLGPPLRPGVEIPGINQELPSLDRDRNVSPPNTPERMDAESEVGQISIIDK